jgi:two-component system, NarL family, invasion response regulator UvrY
MKVLIVDDHVTVREGVRKLLAPFPEIIVHDASSAAEAIAAYRSNRPDVVLLYVANENLWAHRIIFFPPIA